MRTKITPNADTFYAVSNSAEVLKTLFANLLVILTLLNKAIVILLPANFVNDPVLKAILKD